MPGGYIGSGTVPQTGKISAAGLAIESQWGVVPTTLQAVNNYYVGTPGTNPLRYPILDPGGGFSANVSINTPDDELDGDGQLARMIKESSTYDGGFTQKVEAEGMYYLLLALFGRDLQTVLNASGSSASPLVAKHQFRYGRYAPSFTLEELLGDGTNARLTTGVNINDLEITAGKTLTARWAGHGYRHIPNTYINAAGAGVQHIYGSTPTIIPAQMGGDGVKTLTRTPAPTYVNVDQGNNNNGALTFGDMKFGTVGGAFASSFVTVDDVPYPNAKILEGHSYKFTRGTEQHMVGGSGYDIGATNSKEFMVGGKMNMLFLDHTLLAAYTNFSKVGLNMQYIGPPIGLSGRNFALEFYFPNVKFTSGPVPLDATKLMFAGDWRARRDPALGYDCLVTLTCTVDNSTLAGQYNTSPGGLGGWLPA